MKFIDEVKIEVRAGKGGAGCKHFRREKFVPLGGPDGGNGGKGGSIILVADSNKHTLLDFHYKPRWEAQNGEPGDKNRKDGKDGKDEVIHVPIGTQILDPFTGELVADLCSHDQSFELASGGRGGKGNTFFKSATNRAPEHAQPGEAGHEGSYTLSLKLLADVGLVGLPNAGKSTFISTVSNAKPKVADYPFTTKEPHLGVLKFKTHKPVVLADIPGLIPGASDGKGMGIQFLKHVERSRVLLHLIDPVRIEETGEMCSPTESYEQIAHELNAFGEHLNDKKQLVVITKMDAVPDPEMQEQIKANFKAKGIDCFMVSSIKGSGMDELLNEVCRLVHQ